jgi:hypothetical protein
MLLEERVNPENFGILVLNGRKAKEGVVETVERLPFEGHVLGPREFKRAKKLVIDGKVKVVLKNYRGVGTAGLSVAFGNETITTIPFDAINGSLDQLLKIQHAMFAFGDPKEFVAGMPENDGGLFKHNYVNFLRQFKNMHDSPNGSAFLLDMYGMQAQYLAQKALKNHQVTPVWAAEFDSRVSAVRKILGVSTGRDHKYKRKNPFNADPSLVRLVLLNSPKIGNYALCSKTIPKKVQIEGVSSSTKKLFYTNPLFLESVDGPVEVGHILGIVRSTWKDKAPASTMVFVAKGKHANPDQYRRAAAAKYFQIAHDYMML